MAIGESLSTISGSVSTTSAFPASVDVLNKLDFHYGGSCCAMSGFLSSISAKDLAIGGFLSSISESKKSPQKKRPHSETASELFRNK